ncbi:MAG: methyltransferase domain-containing protein [Candidatus Bathyarchaeia archaeon]
MARRDMVAIMNEALELEVGHKVLEVGAGSGWHASTIAEIVAPNDALRDKWGHVYTVEIIPALAEFARRNIERAGYSDRVTVICCDGSEGYPKKAPFDRILVTAAAPYVPKPLKEQLKPGGVMVIPVGDVGFYQTLIRVRKTVDNRIIEEDLGGVAFVPLVGKHGHKIGRRW